MSNIVVLVGPMDSIQIALILLHYLVRSIDRIENAIAQSKVDEVFKFNPGWGPQL